MQGASKCRPGARSFPILGQPDPIYPVRYPKNNGPSSQVECGRPGFVSVWVGAFASVEEAEAYFGIPDDVGVYLPAEGFAADLGLADFPPDALEVNFEQVTPRPLRTLLEDATFAGSFLDQAVEAAARQGVQEAQGIALLYDFDYRLKPERRDVAGPVRFIGAFPFIRLSPRANLQPFRDIAGTLRYPVGAVLFVFVTLQELGKKLRQGTAGEAVPISARAYCEHLLACRGEQTAAILRESGLRRSEDVGRIMAGLVNAGLVRRNESDTDADFQGLFVLE
jgi:uncharacterized repeat protein (TIGR04138 family)